MQRETDPFHPHRFWQDRPAAMPCIDAEDAKADLEDSLSERYAFLLGEDLGRCRLKTTGQWPVDAMAGGYAHGLKRPAQHADLYLRKLLGLRASAYDRGLPVSSAITLDYLKSIAVPVCPVSGVELTRSTQRPTDWSVERLENNLGYVPGNLCIVSKRVNELKGTSDLAEMLGHAAFMVHRHRGDGLHVGSDDELSALEALRLASLMSGPSGWVAGKVGKLPPLAAAPGVWGTPMANLAIVHVQCARSRVEGTAHYLRAQWLKLLGREVWRQSNRLVMRLQQEFDAGAHPCDVWMDPEMAGPLEELMQAVFAGQASGATAAERERAVARCEAAVRPIQSYYRLSAC